MMYTICLVIGFLMAFGIMVGVLWMIAADLSGAPYVPSDNKFLKIIMEAAESEPGKIFLDIGSGDGRAVRMAASKYKLLAIGIEIQPFLVWFSRFYDRIQGITNTEYLRINVFSGRLPKCDYIFFYLFPGTVERLGQKILQEAKPGTLVISRGFEVKILKPKLDKKIEIGGRRAYFYRV